MRPDNNQLQGFLQLPIQVPKNGWIVYAPTIGEYCIVNPSLDSLARVVDDFHQKQCRKYPDGERIQHIYELGRKVNVGLDSHVSFYEPEPVEEVEEKP